MVQAVVLLCRPPCQEELGTGTLRTRANGTQNSPDRLRSGTYCIAYRQFIVLTSHAAV